MCVSHPKACVSHPGSRVGSMTTANGWSVVAELAASQHGAFHRSQAAPHLTAGRLRRAVARGELRRPLSDVFVFASHASSWHQRLKVLDLAGGLISHRAAAALHQLDGFAPGKLEVTVPRGRRRAWPDHTVVHQAALVETDRTVVDEIACTTVARTLIDLAQVVAVRKLEPALDSARRNGLSLDELAAAADRAHRPGRTGVAPLRALVHERLQEDVVPDSMFEHLVERVMVDAGLPRPVRQFEIELSSGKRRVDLAWPAAKVAVEAHSKRWHFGRAADERDNNRDLDLAAVGWEVFYVTWATAHSPARFVATMRAVLQRRWPRASGV